MNIFNNIDFGSLFLGITIGALIVNEIYQYFFKNGKL